MKMSIAKVPRETLAIALGADELAAELARSGHEVVRTGSYGLCWAEPMIDIDGIAYGPVTDLADLDAARLGPVDALPDLARQERRVFDRCGRADPFDYDPAWVRSQLERDPAEIIDESRPAACAAGEARDFRLTSSGARWHDTPADEKFVVVNADEGDSGTFADRLIMEGDPFRLIEGMLPCWTRRWRAQGYRLPQVRISAGSRNLRTGDRVREGDGTA